MVFQNYGLYPHMTVRQNMGYALKLARNSRSVIAERVDEAARILQIEPLLDRYPRQLSGGQRQRVAIGRCITRHPRVFLFDEPLSNLDASLRADMRAEIARLAERLRTTMVYVTHDQVEAMTLSDRIVILDRGEIQQVDEPDELYRNPANKFVAAFIGSPRINFINGELAPDGELIVSGASRSLSVLNRPENGAVGKVEVGLRPEHLTFTDNASEGLPGEVALVERIGAEGFMHVDSPASCKPIIVRLPTEALPRPGQKIGLLASMQDAHLFDPSGARITAQLPLFSAN
jgi:ABC-type sugar transport system ATPase subunit